MVTNIQQHKILALQLEFIEYPSIPQRTYVFY